MLAALDGAALVGIYDPRAEVADSVAGEFGTRASARRSRSSPAQTDAMVVAVPTVSHAELGCRAARARPSRAGREADRAATSRTADRLLASSAAIECSPSATSSSTTPPSQALLAAQPRAAVRRGPAALRSSAAQPRRRRHPRPDDPRPADPARARPQRRCARCGPTGIAVLSRAHRHRQRAGRARVGLRRQPHRLAGLGRAGAQAAAVLARALLLARLPGAGAQGLPAGDRGAASGAAASCARSPVERAEPLRRELEAFVAACRGESRRLVDGAPGPSARSRPRSRSPTRRAAAGAEAAIVSAGAMIAASA